MPADHVHSPYALLDCGNGRRLERFSGFVVSRPAPAADFPPALPPSRWNAATLSYNRETGWRGDAPSDWRVAFGPAVMTLRPAGGGQLGVFPEHAAVAESLDAMLSANGAPEGGWRILNLFAHTGLATLRLAARSDVGETVHVDAAPASVRQARDNAAASGLEDRRIRWIKDDASAFVRREARRGNAYDLVLADPPAYGRGGRGKGDWKLERDLPDLLTAMSGLLSRPGSILCLACHRVGWDAGALAGFVGEALPGFSVAERRDLSLSPESGGRALPAGCAVLAMRR